MPLDIVSGGIDHLPFSARHPAPTAIWTQEWAVLRRRLLDDALTNPDLLATFRTGAPLPEGFGVAQDERIIEWPWVLSHAPRGRVLDAGSTLNHAEVLEHYVPHVDDLHILTLEPEPQAYHQLRISYVFADFRELPYRDGWFDCVDSISALEHVGMDNERYGSGVARQAVPDAELARAVRELRRVTRPGGQLLLTVPYGRPDDFGWFRVFDRGSVERMVEALEPADHEVVVYRYTATGWQVSSYEEAADAVYREHTLDPDPVDLAPNARAVACVRAVR